MSAIKAFVVLFLLLCMAWQADGMSLGSISREGLSWRRPSMCNAALDSRFDQCLPTVTTGQNIIPLGSKHRVEDSFNKSFR